MSDQTSGVFRKAIFIYLLPSFLVVYCPLISFIYVLFVYVMVAGQYFKTAIGCQYLSYFNLLYTCLLPENCTFYLVQPMSFHLTCRKINSLQGSKKDEAVAVSLNLLKSFRADLQQASMPNRPPRVMSITLRGLLKRQLVLHHGSRERQR